MKGSQVCMCTMLQPSGTWQPGTPLSRVVSVLWHLPSVWQVPEQPVGESYHLLASIMLQNSILSTAIQGNRINVGRLKSVCPLSEHGYGI